MESDKPKVSIIMPSFNEINYIEECLKSVINQTLKEIEVICVDGESTDGTLDILNQYAKEDPRIQVYTSDKKSYGNQVNLGLSKASGEYIGIIETDDFIKENMFESLYELSENATVDIVKSTFYHYDDYDEENPTSRIDNAKIKLTNKNKFTLKEEPLIIEGHPSVWAGIYRREFIENNNIKMVEEKGGGWVDNPFFYETAIKAETIKYIHEPFYYYRVSNPDSSSNHFTDFTLPMRRILDIFKIFDEYGYYNEDIKRLFYNRLFRYIEIILENNELDYTNLDYPTCYYIQKVLKKVDENFVKSKMKNNFKKLYYKFISPLFLMRFDESEISNRISK